MHVYIFPCVVTLHIKALRAVSTCSPLYNIKSYQKQNKQKKTLQIKSHSFFICGVSASCRFQVSRGTTLPLHSPITTSMRRRLVHENGNSLPI